VLQKPSTLDEVIMLAQAYEQHTMPAPSSRSACRAVSQPPWSTGTTTRTASAAVPALSSTSINQSTIKKFTPTEIDDHRIKGLCFKCDEKFVPGHRYSCKCLFCIELLDDEDDGVELTISLATMTVIQPCTGRTMHVTVLISDTSLQTPPQLTALASPSPAAPSCVWQLPMEIVSLS
jgi:hypothetical protein